jgi:hypothetical protein
MEFQVVVSVVVGLVTIGGLGWKLNAELSKIRSMLEVFMAKSEAKWEQVDKIERRVENLEKKLLMKATGEWR